MPSSPLYQAHTARIRREQGILRGPDEDQSALLEALLNAQNPTFEQQRERASILNSDARYYKNMEGARERQSALDDAEGQAAIRGFETRRGVTEGTGALAGSPSPDGMRTIRRFTQSATPTDADTAASAREKLARDPRVQVEQVRAAADLAAAAAKGAPDTDAEATRNEVIRLAEEIRDSNYLDANVGPLDASGFIPTLRGGSKDFQGKAQRLRDLLALEARSKLKGQGAVSDFEGKMLANSQTSLRADTDEASFRAELDRIIGEQKKKGASAGGARRYNPATGKIE